MLKKFLYYKIDIPFYYARSSVVVPPSGEHGGVTMYANRDNQSVRSERVARGPQDHHDEGRS